MLEGACPLALKLKPIYAPFVYMYMCRPTSYGRQTQIAVRVCAVCALEHYWQVYWASYWKSTSKRFTGNLRQ